MTVLDVLISMHFCTSEVLEMSKSACSSFIAILSRSIIILFNQTVLSLSLASAEFHVSSGMMKVTLWEIFIAFYDELWVENRNLCISSLFLNHSQVILELRQFLVRDKLIETLRLQIEFIMKGIRIAHANCSRNVFCFVLLSLKYTET